MKLATGKVRCLTSLHNFHAYDIDMDFETIMEDFVGVEVRDANGAFYKVIIFFPTAYDSWIFISVMSKCFYLH